MISHVQARKPSEGISVHQILDEPALFKQEKRKANHENHGRFRYFGITFIDVFSMGGWSL